MLIIEALQLALQAFFKPFKLDQELGEIGSRLAANAPVPILDVPSDLSPGEQQVVKRAQVAVILVTLTWPLIGELGALGLGYPLQPTDVLLIALASLSLSAVSLQWVGISFAINVGGAVSLAGTLIAILANQAHPSLRVVALGDLITIVTDPVNQKIGLVIVGLGLTAGLALGLAAIAVFTLRPSAWWFVGACAAFGGLVFGARFAQKSDGGFEHLIISVVLATLFALGAVGGYFVGYRRLPFYLLELTWQVVLSGLSWLATRTIRDAPGRLIRRLYRLSPVTGDELIWFRLWTLDRQLACLALAGERDFALDTIGKIARSFRQGWAAEMALAAIIAQDLRGCQSVQEIAGAAIQLSQFPRAIDLPSLDLRRIITLLHQVSQNAEAATRALDSVGRQNSLGKAQANLGALGEALTQADRRVATLLHPGMQHWQSTIEKELQRAPHDAVPTTIDNPYIAGNPIPPKHSRLLVGREEMFDTIRNSLAAAQKSTLMLHGQRRMGKTSLLLQLSSRLSTGYVPVYVDLQATATVDSLNRFLYTLAREAVRQADETRHLALPPVELGDFDRHGARAFYQWLEETRQRLDGHLLLFALDEFALVKKAVEKGKLDETVLDVLRRLTHNDSPWLSLLLADVRRLEEIDPDWRAYFGAVRPLHVSFLDLEAARKLILLPAESHSLHYDEEAVVTILEATHAQPFLVQAVCFELIQYLNSRIRRLAAPFQVTVADAQEAISRVVRTAEPYFQDLWANSRAPERRVLAELAYSEREWVRVTDLRQGLEPQVVQQALEQLERRELVERKRHERCLRMPMMGQWIRDEVSLEDVRLLPPDEKALESASQRAKPVKIENVYITGNPISANQKEVFVGRDDLFDQIQENLAATQKPTLVLHGQHRTGKTSLLLRLPGVLSGEYVPVYVNLQAAATVDSLNRFLYTLAREAVQQADKERHIALPPVEWEDFDWRSTHAFYEWLDQARRRLEGRLLLLALDEFECIKDAIERGKLETAVLDVLRHLAQHRSPWLILLFAGVCTLEEMGPDWHDYFISVKPLHISYLDLQSARKLILLPEKYSISYAEQAIEAILKATRAQPFLIQAVCFELIQYLNSEKRQLAGPLGRVTIADAEEAIARALHSAVPHFLDPWHQCSPSERILLTALATAPDESMRTDQLGKSLGLSQVELRRTIDKLRRHEWIERREDGYWFQVPMMRQWVQEEAPRI